MQAAYEAQRIASSNCTSLSLLEGENSKVLNLEQWVTQGCSLSPILFSVFIWSFGSSGASRAWYIIECWG